MPRARGEVSLERMRKPGSDPMEQAVTAATVWGKPAGLLRIAVLKFPFLGF